ncbi:MAG TPA: alpha/beta hydrolase [Planktothrix sp.]|jgi:pimeloyl-ACP methyl ester carboxylesterase
MKLAVKIEGPKVRAEHLPDLVLIHGTGANSEMWRPQTNLLRERGYRLFLPEFRGHGDSHEPEHLTDIEAHLQDMLETLSTVSIDWPAVFIGHSLGAIVSLELAERKPDWFKQILAVGMPGRVPQAVAMAFKMLMNAPFEKLRGTAIHERLPWRERTLISTNRFSLEQIVENFAELDYTGRQFDIECPVHFSVGRLDPVAPARHVKAIHKSIPTSTLRVFDWAGHNCMDERPEEFNRWLLEKLQEERISELEDVLEPAPKPL